METLIVVQNLLALHLNGSFALAWQYSDCKYFLPGAHRPPLLLRNSWTSQVHKSSQEFSICMLPTLWHGSQTVTATFSWHHSLQSLKKPHKSPASGFIRCHVKVMVNHSCECVTFTLWWRQPDTTLPPLTTPKCLQNIFLASNEITQ